MDPNLSFNIQQLMGEINTLQLNPTQSLAKASPTDTLQKTNKDTNGKSALDDLAIGTPILAPPVSSRGAADDSGIDFSQAAQTTLLDGVNDIDNQVQVLLDNHPEALFLLKAFEDVYTRQGMPTSEVDKTAKQELLKLINKASQQSGNFTALTAANPKLPSIIASLIEKFLEKGDCINPDVKADAFVKAIDYEKLAVQYAEGTLTINATGKTLSDEPSLILGNKLTTNMSATLSAVIATMGKEQGILQMQDGERMSLLNYLKTINDLVNEIKQTFYEIQTTDQYRAKDLTQTKIETVEKKKAVVEQQIKDAWKQMKNMQLMQKTAKFLKIMGYVLSGLMLCFSLLFIVMCPIVTILLFIVGAALLTLQISLTETGAMNDLFRDMQKLIDACSASIASGIFHTQLSREDLKMYRMIFWQIVVVLIVVVAVVLIAVTGATIGAVLMAILSMVLQTIISQSQMWDQTVKFILQALHADKDEGLHMGLTILLGTIGSLGMSLVFQLSSMIGEVLEGIIGMIINLVIQIIKKVIELVITLIKKIYDLIDTIRSGGTKLITESIKEFIKSILSMIVNFIKAIIQKVIDFFKKIIDAVKSAVQTVAGLVFKVIMFIMNISKAKIIELIKLILEKIVDLINKVVNILFTTITNRIESMIDEVVELIPKKVEDLIEKIINLLQKIVGLLENLYKDLATFLTTTLKILSNVVSIVGKVAQAAQFKNMAETEKLIGKTEEFLYILTEYIKTLSGWINEIMGAEGAGKEGSEGESSKAMQQINALTKFFMDIVKGMRKSTDAITKAAYIP